MIAEAEERPTYEDLFLQNTQLRHELDQLKRLIYGSRHERFIPSVSPDQLALGISVGPQEHPATSLTQTIQYQRKKVSKIEAEKVQTGRMALHSTLPRQEEIIKPIEDVTGWTEIGVEITEVL